MPRNPGHLPDDCLILDDDGEVTGHRRVHVQLFNGHSTRTKEPAGWPSGGRGACNWRISKPPHPYEIEFFEVIA